MELFRLFGSIIIDDEKAIKALNDFDKKTKNAQSTLANFGKSAVIAGTAVAAGLGAMLVSGTRDAMDAEEKIAQLDAVLASTGGTAGMTRESIMALAEGLEQTTKFSAEMALEAQSLLLTFTNIGQETFPRATQAAADMATAMGTDMAGQSIALGKALNDPIAGIASLTRVGVQFTDEQKNAIQAMMDSNDIAGAQSVILTELEKQFGGSAVAAGDTFAGQLEILKNQFGAVSESMAVQLMPYLKQFLDWINTNMPTIKKVFEDVMDGIVNAIEWVSDNLDWLLPVLAGVLAGFVAFQIISVISALFTVLSGVIAGVSGVMAILNAVMAANPIGLVALAIGALIAIGVALWMNWDTVVEKAKGLWQSIKDIFGKIKDFVSNVWDTITSIIKLPTITIQGDLNPLTWLKNGIPKFNVNWNADGGIFDRPTIFNTRAGLQGVWESGPEAIMPLSKLDSMLSNNGIDYDLLADKMVQAMSKVTIVLDKDEVGTFVDKRILKGAY